MFVGTGGLGHGRRFFLKLFLYGEIKIYMDAERKGVDERSGRMEGGGGRNKGKGRKEGRKGEG